MGQIFNWLDRYTDAIQLFVQNHLVLAPLLLLLAEEMGIPLIIPGDAIIAYVGYSLSLRHTATLWQAFIVALLSVLIGATVLFFVSKRWGKLVINKVGHFVFIRQKHIDRAEKMFNRYGVWAVIFGRHVPGLRIPITIFAASSGMRYRTFIASTFASTVLWIFFYLKIGKTLGANLQTTFRHDSALTLAAVAAVIILVLGLHFYGLHRLKIKSESKQKPLE